LISLSTSCLKQAEQVQIDKSSSTDERSNDSGEYFTSVNYQGASSITNKTDSTLTLNWNELTDAVGYEVYDTSSSIPVWITTVFGQSSLSYDIKNLTPGSSYKFRVRAKLITGAYDNNKNDLSVTMNDAPEVPTAISLVSPSTNTDVLKEPIFQVSGLKDGDTALIFTDDQCTQQVGSATAQSTTAEVTSSTLTPGSYTFYAQAKNSKGNVSTCSTVAANYSVIQAVSALATNTSAEFITIPSNFTNLNKLPTKNIEYIHKDANDVFYFGHQLGLSISHDEGRTFSTKTTAHGLASNVIQSVHHDSHGNIYVDTTGGLSVSTDTSRNSFTTYKKPTLSGDVVNDVYAYNGSIYIATDEGISFTSDGINFTNITSSTGLSGLSDYNITQIAMTSAVSTEYMLVSNADGVFYSTDGGQSFSNTGIPQADGVYGIEASGEKVFVANGPFAPNAGIYASDNYGENFTKTSSEELIADITLSGVALYVSFWDAGLKISTDNGTTLTTLLSDGMGTINFDEDGNLYYASPIFGSFVQHTGLISNLDTTSTSVSTIKKINISSDIDYNYRDFATNKLELDSNNTLYAATTNGAYKYDLTGSLTPEILSPMNILIQMSL
jgi:hypothetical protein